MNSNLFISGGKNSNKIFLFYDSLKNELKKLENSIFSHEEHSMFYDENFIYLIGGKFLENEKYNLKTKKFEQIPKLKKIQKFPSLFLQKNILFVFNGLNEKNEITTQIQKINFSSLFQNFEEISYKNLNNLNIKIFRFSIFEINENVVYFLGGKDEKGKISNEILEFNLNNYEIKKSSFKLNNEGFFNQSQLAKISENNFGLFSLENGNPFLKISFIKN